MRARALAVATACVLAAVAVAATTATAGTSGARATGGGQNIADPDTFTGGPANTIAFSAIGKPTASDSDLATGQVQIVDRAAGGGKSQVKYHGTVTCLRVDGNQAFVAGTLRGGGFFHLFVQDNGEGSNATGNDLAVFNVDDDQDCDFSAPKDPPELFRGNAQVSEPRS